MVSGKKTSDVKKDNAAEERKRGKWSLRHGPTYVLGELAVSYRWIG